MALSADYPDNWEEMALAVKVRANWQCEKCGKQCLTQIDAIKRQAIPRSEWMRETLQVHHWDRDPGNSDPENLVAVCTGCHLQLHQGRRSNVSPGQLSLWSKLRILDQMQVLEPSKP